jgi:putative FmdB family regulatory protein
MPLYEYKCFECGEITEVLRPIKSRDDATYCTSCGSATERIMSRFNTLTTSNSREPRDSYGAYESDRVARKPRGTGIRLEGGTATMKDCSFENLQTGISMAKGAKLSMHGSRFENVGNPVEVTDE